MKSGRTIFLVDDDLDDQEIFALALDEINPKFTCVSAKNGLEAMEKLKERTFRPDFIFLDLNMPRMNGIQCLVEIKKDPELRDVPVVIYTTSSESRHKEETLGLGATAFMTKPPGIEDLVSSLQEIFRHFQ
jgi:CheY-like chemotaxis protein